MEPAQQTSFGKKGNCFSACIASILEVPLDTVPVFCVDFPSRWAEKANEWLHEHHGVMLFCVTPPSEGFVETQYKAPFYHIMSGPALRGLQHSVVGRNGKMVYDPHPSGDGLTKVTEWDLFLTTHTGMEV